MVAARSIRIEGDVPTRRNSIGEGAMEIPAIVRPTPDGGYRASSLDLTAEGPTSEGAVEALRGRLQAQIDSGAQVVAISVSEPPANPWMQYAGIFEGDPWFERWQAAIEENRRAEEGEAAAP
jgi:hypothetical protein